MYRSSLTTFLESSSVLFFLTSLEHDEVECSDSVSSKEMTSRNYKAFGNRKFIQKSNPEKRVENPLGIFFLQKIKKKKILFV